MFIISNSPIIIHNYYLTSTFILALLLSLPLLSNGANSEYYSACSALYSCGRVRNIGYPFWGGDRPQYCGASDFKLNCLVGAEYPTMNVYNNGYLGLSVEEINTSSHTMLISRKKLLQSCYVQDTSKVTYISTLKPNPSIYTSTISMFYGCNNNSTSCKINTSKSFPCTNSDNTIGYAYYFGHTADEISKNSTLLSLLSSCSCKNNVSSPVEGKQIDELRNTNVSIWSVLTDLPVEMVYTANFVECSECEKSGGRCGSSSQDEFVCYCKNGDRSLTCSSSGGRRKLALILGSVVGIMVLIALVIYAIKIHTTENLSFIWSKTAEDQSVATFLKSYGSLAPKRYTYADIRKMTNSFKEELGEGGYGTVYKGRLNDGRYVAVKNLKILKGDDGKDFMNEVLSISRTNHVNIVTLLGFCYQGKKRALVFEFLHNGSLEKFIHGGVNSPSLKCETKFNIAVGIAKGLDYLHRGCNTKILHFDIKPHNILLDEEFHPKISDFGLARLCPPEHSMISMSEARGTIGYIAPEVFSRSFGCISHKSDVYSYGMMLLDLVYGRKNIAQFDPQGNKSETYFFPAWVYNRLSSMEEVEVHESMSKDDKQVLERKMILVSLWCIQTYHSDRPPMNKVVEMLEGPLELLQMPPKPYLSSPARSMFDDLSLASTSLSTS